MKVDARTPEFMTFLELVNGIAGNGGKNTFVVNFGRRYARIVSYNGVQRHAYGFVNLENGDVLKSASWKTPAKHARGNIFNDDNGAGAIGPYGVNYLR